MPVDAPSVGPDAMSLGVVAGNVGQVDALCTLAGHAATARWPLNDDSWRRTVLISWMDAPHASKASHRACLSRQRQNDRGPDRQDLTRRRTPARSALDPVASALARRPPSAEWPATRLRPSGTGWRALSTTGCDGMVPLGVRGPPPRPTAALATRTPGTWAMCRHRPSQADHHGAACRRRRQAGTAGA